MEHQGRCLCGAVGLTITEAEPIVSACHCSMCRKWTAGPFLSIDAGTSANIRFTGAEKISRFRSSDWAERGFCKVCGSALFYHGLSDDRYYVPVDLLNTVEQARLCSEIMFDNKPAYYTFRNQTQKKLEAEIYREFTEE